MPGNITEMDFDNLQVLLLHKHPEFTRECCDMINEEWPRSETARMMSLRASCDDLPTSLILINDKKLVLGHCKLTAIPTIPESCFIETVVISKAFRGKKLGTYLMRKVEEHCKYNLKLKMVHLSTKGQENFYAKLGYEICPPVSIYGSHIPNYKPTEISHKVEIPVPIKTAASSTAPPPPPMPRNENLINNNVIKSNKTFMFKYL
ncbi:N-alpha-acetyltransferase 80 [Pectinophora gossypiella]|uniref:N-alpha-acetyltransferase 80 n=1 Tax=Pectinophora gossypiella TaxID=13191 RepID=UPI00214DFD5A|nr:N-alpha-acetyltransferase 80 [Pectinophora gossypiella]